MTDPDGPLREAPEIPSGASRAVIASHGSTAIASHENAVIPSDRRTVIVPDRRRRPTPLFSRYTLRGGRRRASRRAGDPSAVYVDRIGRGVGTVLVAIFVFHCLDAGFTLAHIARGGKELNPFMDLFLRMGAGHFVGFKLSMAGLGLIFLGLHVHFPMVRKGIAGLFILYALVIGYHLFLLLGA